MWTVLAIRRKKFLLITRSIAVELKFGLRLVLQMEVPKMMEFITAVAAVVAALIMWETEARESREASLSTFANYLRAMADSLDEMFSKLREGVVPTQAGNRLEAAIADFQAHLAGAQLTGNILNLLILKVEAVIVLRRR
jgi:hypothetical protein